MSTGSPVITEGGREWLLLDRLTGRDSDVLFIATDGSQRSHYVQTWDVFKYNGVHYEVQGFDRARNRAWVERVTDLPAHDQVMPAGKPADPRDDRPGWSQAA